jgi:hypothetical protein
MIQMNQYDNSSTRKVTPQDYKNNHDMWDVVARYTDVPQRHRGKRQGMVRCCFHQERTASMSINAHKKIYYCFGCHEGGDMIALIMKMEKKSFSDVLGHPCRGGVKDFGLGKVAPVYDTWCGLTLDERVKNLDTNLAILSEIDALNKAAEEWSEETLRRFPLMAEEMD